MKKLKFDKIIADTSFKFQYRVAKSFSYELKKKKSLGIRIVANIIRSTLKNEQFIDVDNSNLILLCVRLKNG